MHVATQKMALCFTIEPEERTNYNSHLSDRSGSDHNSGAALSSNSNCVVRVVRPLTIAHVGMYWVLRNDLAELDLRVGSGTP